MSSEGEYGEGINYLNYVSEILLPVVYLGLQEQYLYGTNAGNNWLTETSELVLIYRTIGDYLLNVANNWGELPAFDDGPPVIPYLAPYAVITGQAKYLGYARDMQRLKNLGVYDNLESAERVSIHGNAPWRMLLYPYNRSFTGSAAWQPSLESVRHVASIVQIPAGTVTDNLNMTIIAEENPGDGGTHDQIDHGAIQFARYMNNAAGNAPHVDHLIIDPGYPGFQDNKRYLREWQYCNQNVQMLWDSDFSFSTDETEGEHSVPSEEPDKDADDEEFLGFVEGKDFNTVEKFNYKENGGMTGYRYLTPWEIREIVHKYVLRDGGLQDNVWEIVDTDAMGKIESKSLHHKGGEGKSTVISRYKNGVEIKIDYKYPTSQEIFHFKEQFLFQEREFYYSRDINYESSHYGIRGVYTLGNNYYIIDHLPETGLPPTISLATSWNMPKNTSQLGTSGWQQFVFEGTTPDPLTTPYIERSRIELAVAGATGVTSVNDNTSTFQIKENEEIVTNHIVFENSMLSSPFMVTQVRVCDAALTLSGVTSQQQDIVTITGGILWTRKYKDGTIDLICYNPAQTAQTVEGISSDAKVWLLYADNTGTWQSARLFNSPSTPTFAGYPTTPVVIKTGGAPDQGAQYDITF